MLSEPNFRERYYRFMIAALEYELLLQDKLGQASGEQKPLYLALKVKINI